MRKLTVTTLVLGLIALSGASAWAWGGGPCPFGGPGNNATALTQEQITELQNAHTKFMEQTLEPRAQLASKMEQLNTLYAQANPDKQKIIALQNEIIDLRAAIAKQANTLQAGLSTDLYRTSGCMGLHMMNGPDIRGGYGHHMGMMGPGGGSGWQRGPGHHNYR